MINISIGSSGNNIALLKQALLIPIFFNDINFTRASIATLIDFEGLIKTSNVNEIRFEGLRRLENVIKNEDLRFSFYEIDPTVTIEQVEILGELAYKITHSAIATRCQFLAKDGNISINGDSWVGRFEVLSGSISSVKFTTTDQFSRNSNYKTATLPSIWGTSFSDNVLFTNAAGNLVNFILRATGSGYYYVRKVQIEKTTGQSNQNPSEFTLPQQQNNQLNYYKTENANTVDSNGIVIKATGNLIPYYKKKGILIEGQRINLIAYSEEFNNAVWQKIRTIITSNVVVSPNGALNADKITDIVTTSNNTHKIFIVTNISNNNNLTVSFYVKKGSLEWCYLEIERKDGIRKRAWFNLSLGTIGTVDTEVTAFIEKSKNGFYRAIISTTVDTGISLSKSYLGLTIADGVYAYLGSGTGYIYGFGGQGEQGKFPTSYIKTEDSTITRIADNLSYEVGVGKFPQSFSLSMEVTPITNGTNYNDVEFRLFSTNDNRGAANQIQTIGDVTYNFDGTTFHLNKSDFSKNVRTKLCFSFKQDGSNIKVVIVKDGIEKLSTIIAGSLDHSNLGILNIGHFGDDYFSGNFRNIQLYFIPFKFDEVIDVQTDYFVDENNNHFVDELGNQITTIL